MDLQTYMCVKEVIVNMPHVVICMLHKDERFTDMHKHI